MAFFGRHLVGPLPFLVAALGCVQGNEPIRILSTVALRGTSAQCVLDTVQQPRGTLDLAVNGNYSLGFLLESSLQPISEQVGTTTVSSDNRNDFYADYMVYSYTSSPPKVFKSEKLPLTFSIQAGASDVPLILRSMLTEALLEKLQAEVEIGDVFLLDVEFYLQGHLGNGLKVRSNSVSYPITVTRSDFSGCPAGLVVDRNGPCGRVGGQDDAPIKCVVGSP